MKKQEIRKIQNSEFVVLHTTKKNAIIASVYTIAPWEEELEFLQTSYGKLLIGTVYSIHINTDTELLSVLDLDSFKNIISYIFLNDISEAETSIQEKSIQDIEHPIENSIIEKHVDIEALTYSNEISKFLANNLEFVKDEGLFITDLYSKYKESANNYISTIKFLKVSFDILHRMYDSEIVYKLKSDSDKSPTIYLTNIGFKSDIIEDIEVVKEEEELYNLLPIEEKTYEYITNTSCDKDKSNCDKDKSNYRKLFNRDEVEKISQMNTVMMCISYNIPEYIARRMIRNARKILSLPIKSYNSNDYHNYMEYWKMGKSLNEVLALFDDKCRRSIKISWERFQSRNYINDKWENINIKDFDTEEKLYKLTKSIFKTTRQEFANNENIPFDKVTLIKNKCIQNIIYRNPLAIIFQELAFDSETFNKYISDKDSIINSHTRYDIINLYDDIMIMKKAYEESYEYHDKIISGEAKIPKSLPNPKEYKQKFMNLLITGRMQMLKNNFTWLTDEDLEFIKNQNNSMSDISKKFMIPYDKIIAIKNKYR